MFVDIGSTTTDIIPIGRFEELKGLTDLDRLQQGYLIYTGLLRTSVPCLIRSVLLDGVPTPVSSEYLPAPGMSTWSSGISTNASIHQIPGRWQT